MKKNIVYYIIVVLLLTACNNKKESGTTLNTSTDSTIINHEENVEMNSTMPDSATATKNWMAYGKPGEMHKMMASWDGTWIGDASMWQAPGAPVEKATLTSENKMLMDGRYEESKTTGTMMGQPFTGISTLAYDNATKEFINTWIDNMGTGLMVMKGKWDEPTKSMTLSGKMVDPSTGKGKMVDMKQVITIIDSSNQKMEMFIIRPDGKEFKNMEIISKRK